MKKKDYKIHRLVAYFFINKYEQDKIINHIDENKLNNYYKNLEILNNKKENTTYSLGKKIYQIDMKTNEIINSFNSIHKASKTLNLSFQNISYCVNEKK